MLLLLYVHNEIESREGWTEREGIEPPHYDRKGATCIKSLCLLKPVVLVVCNGSVDFPSDNREQPGGWC